MKLYNRIADFNICVEGDFEFSEFKCLEKKELNFDMVIKVEQQDIYEYRQINQCNTSKFGCASMLTFAKIAKELPKFNAFLLHSATFEIDGQGIAFSAKSGTGKTTHMLNWQKLLSDKMTIVNGDKPIVRFFEDDPCTPYAYGTPWCGKEHFGNNSRTPLKHICFIERSETNYVTRIDKVEALSRIMKQVYMPANPQNMAKTLVLIDRLLSCCNLWIIHCNMDIESAEVAYNTIFAEK